MYRLVVLAALAGLGADVQQTHLGVFQPQQFVGVKTAHAGELEEVFRCAFCVGTGVDENGLPLCRGDDRRHRCTADAGDALNQEGSTGQNSAGAAGRQEGVPFACHQQVHAHGQGGVLLPPPGGGRVVADLNDLGGVVDGQAVGQVGDTLFGQGLADDLLLSHQDHLAPVGLDGLQGAGNRSLRGEIAAHCVDDQSHRIQKPPVTGSVEPGRPAPADSGRRSCSASP